MATLRNILPDCFYFAQEAAHKGDDGRVSLIQLRLKEMSDAETYVQWQNKFHECLEIEFSNPEYFKVHHILVPTYMLHIGAYSEAVRTDVLEQLKRFLADTSKPPSSSDRALFTQTGERIKAQGGSFRSDTSEMSFIERNILEIRTDTAEHYCADVAEWSRWLVGKMEGTES